MELSKLELIGKTYVLYHAERKIIDDLKYDRNVEFKRCEDEEDKNESCYVYMKMHGNMQGACKNCIHSWRIHLKIIKHGAIAGGFKNKLNHLIKSL